VLSAKTRERSRLSAMLHISEGAHEITGKRITAPVMRAQGVGTGVGVIRQTTSQYGHKPPALLRVRKVMSVVLLIFPWKFKVTSGITFLTLNSRGVHDSLPEASPASARDRGPLGVPPRSEYVT